MKQSNPIEHENKRLSVLYQSQLLDSVREESFDAITMITAQTCDMPVSLICLVDAKRIWFKSTQGIDGVSELPRDIGFCTQTITQPDLLEIKDATLDKQFHDNPMVVEHKYKYYAGVPLTTIDGYALGTLCVMDKKPRALSEENKEFLKRMAFTVAALIEARISSNKQTPSISQISQLNANKRHLENQSESTDNENIHYPKVYIIDEDENITSSLNTFFLENNITLEIFSSPEQFFKSYRNQPGCLISETNYFNSNGLTLQEQCKQQEINIPIIFIAAKAEISTSVAAIRAGAIDFIEKPLDYKQLLISVFEAFKLDQKKREIKQRYDIIMTRLETLTARERQVMELLVSNRASLSNKDIAEKLAISPRTVEVHRSTIMAKMLANSRLELLDIANACQISSLNEV